MSMGTRYKVLKRIRQLFNRNILLVSLMSMGTRYKVLKYLSGYVNYLIEHLACQSNEYGYQI